MYFPIRMLDVKCVDLLDLILLLLSLNAHNHVDDYFSSFAGVHKK